MWPRLEFNARQSETMPNPGIVPWHGISTSRHNLRMEEENVVRVKFHTANKASSFGS